jgi:hypothetical protein
MVFQNIFDIYIPILNVGEEEIENQEEEIYKIQCGILAELKIHNIIRVNNRIIRGYSIVVLKKDHRLFLHIFKKKFNKNYGNNDDNYWTLEGEYISTIILNSKIHVPKKYDWIKIEPENELELVDDDIVLKKITDDQKKKRKPNLVKLGLTAENISITMNNLLEYNYKPNITNLGLINPGEFADLLDLDFYQDLYHSEAGVEFNPADIRWQIFIRECLINSMGRNEPYIIHYLRYTDFEKSTLKTAYFPDYKNTSIFEQNITIYTCIECDMCKKDVKEFFHNFIYGDLCQVCFNKKKERDIERIGKIKNLILLQGRKNIFTRELEKTRAFLKGYAFVKLPKKKRDKIMFNAFKDLRTENQNSDSKCGICLNNLFRDPSFKSVSSGLCGHCFHKQCIDELIYDECPMCRESTVFFNLFL